MTDLFNWLVQPCLDFIYHECGFLVQTSPIHLAYSLMRLYTCLLGTCTYKYAHHTYLQSFCDLFAHVTFYCADEIFQSGQEGAESMTSQQVTLWLQALFVFAVVWSLGGTINGNSRKKFDIFYRNLIMGTNTDHPRPQSVKLTKSNVFPERGLQNVFG